MALRSAGRKLSFDILTTSDAETDEVSLPRSISDPLQNGGAVERQSPKKKKKKKRARKSMMENCSIAEDVSETVRDGKAMDQSCLEDGFRVKSYTQSVVETEVVLEAPEGRGDRFVVCTATPSPRLRQRNVSSAMSGGSETEVMTPSVTSLGPEESRSSCGDENDNRNLKEERDRGNEAEVSQQQQQKQQQQRSIEMNGSKLEKEESLDWKKLMTGDLIHAYPLEKSPVKYFLEEMHGGSSLRSTISPSNEKERERVYDTIFRLPWRCELLINVGFFVCLDSFLSLLTIMPTRITLMFWRLLKTSSRNLQQKNYVIWDVSLSLSAE